MRALVTGAAGFLGARVVRALLDSGVGAVEAWDLAAPPDALADDPRVAVRVGDLIELAREAEPADLVVHLAGVVSGAAEADLDLGLRVNLDGTRALLDAARGWRSTPTVVFASSLAVFGRHPSDPPLGVVDDDTLPRPQSSYGAQKFAAELLVADYARRGLIRARSLRLMTVTVRPGAPNAAASSFVSGIIREPIAGERARCGVDPGTELAVSSPSRTVAAIVRAGGIDDATWGPPVAVTLPGLVTTPREMAASLDRIVGPGTSALIDWEPDPEVARIVEGWPARFRTPRADALGFRAPSGIDEIVREHLAEVARG